MTTTEYEAGESNNAADWTFALAEIANLPEEVARLNPAAFAEWPNEHWTDRDI